MLNCNVRFFILGKVVYSMDINQIIIELICPLIVLFVGIFWKNRQSMSIESEELFRVGISGIPERINEDKEYYSNPLYHRLTVKSNKKEIVSSVELFDINIKTMKFIDILFDVCFNEELQKYVLIAINNGNYSGEIKDAYININAVEKNLDKRLLHQIKLREVTLEPGDVLSLSIVDLVKIGEEFIKLQDLLGIKIEVIMENKMIPSMGLFFDYEKGCFRGPQLGCGIPPVKDILVFEIRDGIKSLKKDCGIMIGETEQIGFATTVEQSCQLKYKVRLYIGKKKITSNKYNVANIRIPKYTLERSCINGPFYKWISEINPNLEKFSYSFQYVLEQNKNLIYTSDLIIEELKKKSITKKLT